MPLVPWSDIHDAYNSSGAKGLKDFVEDWLIRTADNQQKVRIVDEVLQPTAPSDESVSLTVRLLTIKSILDASNMAIRPGSVFGNVQLRVSFLNWLGDIAQSSGGYSASASVRGGVIAIFALIVKRFPKESSKFVVIGLSLQVSLRDAAAGLTAQEITALSLVSSPCAMLLSQAVDVLTMAGDAMLPWLQPVGQCVDSVAQILQFFSLLQLDREGGSSTVAGSVNKLQIKVCKAFSMVVEIYLTSREGTRIVDVTGPAVADAPASVLLLVSGTAIIHDTFQSSFQCALDLSTAASPWTVRRASQLVGSIITAVQLQDQSRERSEEGGGCFPYPSVVEIRRVESLLGLLCCVLDCHHDSSSPSLTESGEGSIMSLVMADSAVDLVEQVMGHLRSSLSPEALRSPSCGGSQKDLRAASSDARKGCIAVAHSLFAALPQWVARDLASQSSVSATRCWTLAVKLLNTPLLFGAAFAASAAAAAAAATAAVGVREDALEEQGGQQERHEAFTRHVLQYLGAALRSVSKYSYAVACDVLTAVQELLEKGCMDVLHSEQDLPALLLTAYLSCPKNTAPSAKAKTKAKSAASDGDSGNAYEWKLHVLSTLKTMFQCATNSRDGSGFSPEFMNRFIVQVCSADIFVLHGALGNACVGHTAFLSHLLLRDSDEEGEEEEGEEEGEVRAWVAAASAPPYSLLPPPPSSTSEESSTKLLTKKEKCRKGCNRRVTKLLGSCEMSEPLVGLLHTLTLTLVAFLDMVNATARTGGCGDLQEESAERLGLLLSFLTDISGRQLLFEDDGAQLCAELEVVSRCLEREVLKCSPAGLDEALAAHLCGALLKTCLRSLRKSFQLGASFGKIIYEISYNELAKCVAVASGLRGSDSDEIGLPGELAPTYELAVEHDKAAVADATLDQVAAEVSASIVGRIKATRAAAAAMSK